MSPGNWKSVVAGSMRPRRRCERVPLKADASISHCRSRAISRLVTRDTGGFMASSLIFPSGGCWEVAASLGDTRLTFVTEVVTASRSLSMGDASTPKAEVRVGSGSLTAGSSPPEVLSLLTACIDVFNRGDQQTLGSFFSNRVGVASGTQSDSPGATSITVRQ